MSHPPSQGPHEGPQPHGPPQDGQAPQGPPPEGPPPQGPPPQGPPQGHPAGPYQPGPPPPPPGRPPYGHPQGGHPYAPGQQPPYGPGQPPYGPGQPPYGPGQPPYGPGQPPGQGGGMSKGAKIGLIGGAAALAVVLVAGIVVVATDPFSSDEPASASAGDESEGEEGTEDENGTDGSDDDNVGGGGPGAEVYEGGRNELIELDEPLTGPRFMSIESDGMVTVELRDAEGDRVDQVHSNYTGSGGKAPYNHRAEQEITQLDVRSEEESWSISDEPLENAETWDDPDDPLEGSGPDVVLIDWESTDVEIEMEHSGESNFAIWAHNTDEVGFSDLLVNEIGEYTGSETMSEDTAFLHIEADGDWVLTPE